jgi:hypothetical protein
MCFLAFPGFDLEDKVDEIDDRCETKYIKYSVEGLFTELETIKVMILPDGG